MNQIVFRTRQSCLQDKSLTGKCHVCLICQDICLAPLRCQTCKEVFCELCCIKWRQKSQQCPKRCSDKWVLSKVDTKQQQFLCPYSPSCLPLEMSEFDSHLLKCPHAPVEIRDINRQREEYRCVKDHKLIFSTNRLTSQHQTRCFECKQYNYCKNECLVCCHFYCSTCRIPSLTKKWCPAKEHIYILKKPHSGFTCEMCKLEPLLLGRKFYDDMSCNFGICETCYEGLPELDEKGPEGILWNSEAMGFGEMSKESGVFR